MPQHLLIIGPSGIGKTSISHAVRDRLDECSVYCLDREVEIKYAINSISEYFVHVGPSQFLKSCIEVTEQIKQECQSEICLIDVGAGALEAGDESKNWLSRNRTIALFASRDELVLRDPLAGKRTPASYIETEFSNNRMAIYQQADYKINLSGKDFEQSVKVLCELLSIFQA